MLKGNYYSDFSPIDIKILYERSPEMDINIYVGMNDVKDLRHINRLKKISNFKLHYKKNSDHNLIKSMKNNGELDELFRGAGAK